MRHCYKNETARDPKVASQSPFVSRKADRSEVALQAEEAAEAAALVVAVGSSVKDTRATNEVATRTEVTEVVDVGNFRRDREAGNEFVSHVRNRSEVLPVVIGELEVDRSLGRNLPSATTPDRPVA